MEGLIKEKANFASYLFHQGTNFEAHSYLGAHKLESGEYVFRVWAPNANAIFLVGDFNGWQDTHPMTKIGADFEIVMPAGAVKSGDRYKYKIINGYKELYKADPYAFYAEKPPLTASVIFESEFKWTDGGWMKRRQKEMSHGAFYSRPINVYEMHLGSWKQKEDGEFLSYKEIADELAPYVKQMGYTHVELMPVMEHPFGGSWGYQVSGYFAPTARYGTPDDLREFMNIMHNAGIGVILDWVPAHFPKDAHGLYEFDGQPLYEYQGADRMEHRTWGTRLFDLGREEIQSFLVSNASYWIEEFHADGLRVDAVAAMLYLDFDKLPHEWVPNVLGDNRNLEAIAFFRKLNSHITGKYGDVLMIAEESSAWANITTLEDGGLGFSMKWNMGWMNDTLAYAECDPIYRKYKHDKLNFSLAYAFGEKYVLPISHDEVVHGKKSLIDKQSGDYWQKFASDRAMSVYMMTHPGKKLSFMGNEFAQFREWDFENELEWFMLEYEKHAKHQYFVAELNHFYLTHPELWEVDDSFDGFKWTDADNAEQSIISYRRISKKGKELVIVINFTPVAYEDFRTGVGIAGTYEEVFNSDAVAFGGSGVINSGRFKSEKIPVGQCTDSIRVRIPPLGAAIFRLARREKR